MYESCSNITLLQICLTKSKQQTKRLTESKQQRKRLTKSKHQRKRLTESKLQIKRLTESKQQKKSKKQDAFRETFFNYFQIDRNAIVVTVFLLVMKQTEVHLAPSYHQELHSFRFESN